MPIYEFQCNACGATSEYLIGLGKDENVLCKHCGSKEMVRILSIASIMEPRSERGRGRTCCGREQRCEAPPCGDGGACRHG